MCRGARFVLSLSCSDHGYGDAFKRDVFKRDAPYLAI